MKKSLIAFILSLLCFSAFAEVRSYSAGPIWNDNDARGKCAAVCASHHGRWNGQWRTVVQGSNSTCDCVKHHRRDYGWGVRRCVVRTITIGPIWNNNDANYKCPRVCFNRGSRWTGQWWTVRPSQASVCQCRRCFDA